MKLHSIVATLVFVFLGLDAAIAGPCKADGGRKHRGDRQPATHPGLDRRGGTGEGVSIRAAMAALERARKADEHGDMSACHAEVKDARKFLRE
jgi:hypothetical protein